MADRSIVSSSSSSSIVSLVRASETRGESRRCERHDDDEDDARARSGATTSTIQRFETALRGDDAFQIGKIERSLSSYARWCCRSALSREGTVQRHAQRVSRTCGVERRVEDEGCAERALANGGLAVITPKAL